jgi:hypothetical protein
MNQFQALTSKLSITSPSNAGQQKEQKAESSEPATVRAAEAVFKSLLHRELPESEKPCAGEIAHYAMGAVSGAAYAAVAARLALATKGFGLLFGVVLWLVADEVAVPVMGLSKGPWEYPASSHAYALASHLVYGATLEAARRGIDQLL